MKTKQLAALMLIVCLFLSVAQSASAFYQPSTGCWPNRDPIGEIGGINLYQFCLNNSVNRIDIHGLQSNVISIPAMIESGWTAKDIAEVAGITVAGATALIAAYQASNPSKGSCKWTCFAKGNVQAIGNTTGLPANVYGFGAGASESEACLAAKRMATQSTPRGGYPRHLRCFSCTKK